MPWLKNYKRELKVFKIPVSNPNIFDTFPIFKEYCKRYVPNLMAIRQFAQPWAKNQPYWVNKEYIFEPTRKNRSFEYARHVLEQGWVEICGTVQTKINPEI